MVKLKFLFFIVFAVASVPVYAQRQLSHDRYDFVLDSIKSMPKVSAVNLYSEYEKNGISWEETYKDKYRILTGVITNVGRDILGMERVISLKTRSEVIKGVPGYRTIDVIYPERLPENVKKALAAYKVGQNVELFVLFRKTPDDMDAVYFNEALPRGYSVQLYRNEELYVNVPDTDIGKQIIFKDENGKALLKGIIKWKSFAVLYENIPYDTEIIEVGDFSVKLSEIKQ